MSERGEMTETTRPAVLFVCVHNAGRSQMAAGYLQALAGDRIDVFSAGSEPGDRVNPAAVAVMAEEGIDLSAATPRVLTVDAVRRADVVITMGCGDACPTFRVGATRIGARRPAAGQSAEAVRAIRDEIKARVETLIAEARLKPARRLARTRARPPCTKPAESHVLRTETP
ncbi:MAG: arsenate reductase ArsC [Microbacterium sp.]